MFVFQRSAFAHFPELQDFALSNVAAVDTRESLNKKFGNLRYEWGSTKMLFNSVSTRAEDEFISRL